MIISTKTENARLAQSRTAKQARTFDDFAKVNACARWTVMDTALRRAMITAAHAKVVGLSPREANSFLASAMTETSASTVC